MSLVWNYKKWGFECTPYSAIAIRDKKKFAQDPTGQDGGLDRMLYQVFMCKYMEYVKNPSHIFNIGQGVVAKRSPHSDWIYFDVE